jgi:peptide/nickel transport system substrate-binding protein
MRGETTMSRSLGMMIAAALAVTAVPAWAQTTLKVRPFGDLKTIDPMVTSDYMVRNHGYMIYDTLFAQDDKGAIKPQMVQSFDTTPDGLTWTFVLRDDLKFHAELHGAVHHAGANCQNADQRGGEGADRLRPVHDEA